MRHSALPALTLAVILLLGGCITANAPGVSNTSTTPTLTPTPEPTATPTPTPAPVSSVPSPSDCLTDAAPQPDSVDGVHPSAYPEPPANVTRGTLVNWTRAFETAYFRNRMLAEEYGDNGHNLTEISASAEIQSMNQTTRGYVLRFSNLGARNYASGLHGDLWIDVGYVINETRVVRVLVDDHDEPIDANDGTVVVSCQS